MDLNPACQQGNLRPWPLDQRGIAAEKCFDLSAVSETRTLKKLTINPNPNQYFQCKKTLLLINYLFLMSYIN